MTPIPQDAQSASPFIQWLFAGTSLTALIGGGWSVVQYLAERKRDRVQRNDELEQRKVELRWRRAQAGKGLLDDLLKDPKADAALHMLDAWSKTFTIDGVTTIIAESDWLNSLRAAPDMATDPTGSFIRDSFDSLFHHFAMLEHHIANDFVLFDDVRAPLEYYVAILAEDKGTHEHYLRHFKLFQSLDFLMRFGAWRNPATSVL